MQQTEENYNAILTSGILSLLRSMKQSFCQINNYLGIVYSAFKIDPLDSRKSINKLSLCEQNKMLNSLIPLAHTLGENREML